MLSKSKRAFCITLVVLTAIYTSTCANMCFAKTFEIPASDTPQISTVKNKDVTSDTTFVPGEVLIEVDGEATSSAVKNLSDGLKKEYEIKTFPIVPHDDGVNGVYRCELPENMNVDSAIRILSDNPIINAVQPNYIYRNSTAMNQHHFLNPNPAMLSSTGNTSVSLEDEQWNLEKIDAGLAWDLIDELKKSGKTSGHPITVGFLDTGVDMDHEDLSSVVIKDLCVDVTSNAVEHNDYPTLTGDTGGHGTQVCGVMAALNDDKGISGIASGHDNDIVRLVVANIYDDYDPSNSTNRGASTESLLRGIAYMTSDEVDAPIVNISLSLKYIGETDAFLNNAVSRAWDNGNIIVCSSGNQNTTSPRYPGSARQAVSVISSKNYTNAWGKCRSSFSNYGNNRKISAPGSKMPTTVMNDQYGFSWGTSFSSSIVSGVMAMMLYVDPSLTPYELRKHVYDTAVDLYSNGFDKYTGNGNVNAYAAVAKAAGVKINIDTHISRPSLKAKATGRNAIRLSWSATDYANKYTIYRSTSRNGKYKKIATVTNEETNIYTNKKLSAGKRYYYKVKANGTKNNRKATSAYSQTVSAKTKK